MNYEVNSKQMGERPPYTLNLSIIYLGIGSTDLRLIIITELNLAKMLIFTVLFIR
jgi:hypothetical protein